MELLLSVIVLGVVYIIGLVQGWKARERKSIRNIQDFVDSVQQKEQKDTIHITIEKHDGILFVYDMNTSSFLAQGNTRQEIEDALKKRFPDKRFACAESNMIRVGFEP